jgi:hypothetical protein
LLLLLLLLLLQQQKGLSFNAMATPTTDVFPHCLPFSLAAAELSSQLSSAQLSSTLSSITEHRFCAAECHQLLSCSLLTLQSMIILL